MTDAELAELFQTQRNEEAAARADAEAERDALRLRLAEVERELLGTSAECDRQRERAKRAERELDIASINEAEARAWLKRIADAALHGEASIVVGLIDTALAYDVEV